NAQFLLFLSAVIKAVDEYQDLLRISVASAGNDHRLGANEAPPAIVSMFIGDELAEILAAIEEGVAYDKKAAVKMEIGVHVLPSFPKDTTDRNRTSPFAFTGNKFEFRMLGSTFSISGPNIILNTAVAEELRQFADELEKADDFKLALNALIRRTIKDHKRIIFNGNNYSDEWVAEAERRGLLNLKSTPDALPYFVAEKNIKLFTAHKIFTESEIHSRYEILLENYSKTINIEALTAVEMSKREILPAAMSFLKDLSKTALNVKACCPAATVCAEEKLIEKISSLTGSLYGATEKLEAVTAEAASVSDALANAQYYRNAVVPAMDEVRTYADALETVIGENYWPFPTYGDLLYGV
ncbi:MAG: glutamine synthetase type III, partial [Clostridiales bacterium]|nr:glutamine synthetase type III [Clostridiales bacterium]